MSSFSSAHKCSSLIGRVREKEALLASHCSAPPALRQPLTAQRTSSPFRGTALLDAPSTNLASHAQQTPFLNCLYYTYLWDPDPSTSQEIML